MHQKRKRIKNSRKKSLEVQKSLEVEKMKSEIALLPRHAAPVAQWTSVLDF